MKDVKYTPEALEKAKKFLEELESKEPEKSLLQKQLENNQ